MTFPNLRSFLGCLLTALTILSPASTAKADRLGFPARSFGKLLLVPNQSTGGNKALLAAQEGGAFEPLSEFNPTDRYRLFGAPVARLDTLILDQDANEQFGVCTANLIAPDVLLTNYHCLPGLNPQEVVIRSVAVFDFLREDQVDAPTFEVDVNPIASDINLDFALLRVAGRPGDQFGYFQLKPYVARPNQSLFLIHHPAGMPKRLTRFRCKAYAPEPYAYQYFRHRCDTLGGSSGSLIFNLDFEVVALHNQGGLNDSSSTSFNRGVSILPLLDHAAFAPYLAKEQPSAPPADKPVLRPMADLLAMQNQPNEPEKPTLPSGFSIYNRDSSSDTTEHNKIPISALTSCDRANGGQICASSFLAPQSSGSYTYNMANLANDDGLAWVENAKGYGEGEWLVFDFLEERNIANIVFRNGYTRTAKTFETNSRLAEITIETSTGSRFRVILSDNDELQQYTLPEPETVKWIKITLDTVYKGSKYPDTALSYVEFR